MNIAGKLGLGALDKLLLLAFLVVLGALVKNHCFPILAGEVPSDLKVAKSSLQTTYLALQMWWHDEQGKVAAFDSRALPPWWNEKRYGRIDPAMHVWINPEFVGQSLKGVPESQPILLAELPREIELRGTRTTRVGYTPGGDIIPLPADE